LNLRRSNRHEQEIPIGVNAGLGHGIRAGDWQCRVVLKHTRSAAAFRAAAKFAVINRPATAVGAAANLSIHNRPATAAGYSAN
jgi:hypothetical protein